MKRHLPLLLALMLLTVGAATPRPCAGNGFAIEEDEKRLWAAAEKAEKAIDSSGLLYQSAELDVYLNSIVKKLSPSDTPAALRLKVSVIRDPRLNAFAFPDGRLYIHQGILVRMENEAQLAAVFSHEMIHALRRHQMREMRDSKSKTAFFATLNGLTGNILAPLSLVGALATIQGYSRDLEREADSEGLRLLVSAGYDPAEAPKIFDILQKDALEENIKESSVFGSHPLLKERLDNYRALLETTYAGKGGGATNAETYHRMIAPLYLDNAMLDLKRGRIDAARQAIETFLKVKSEDAKAHFLLGESWRQSGSKERGKARECYLKAAAFDPAYAEPHRALGLIAYKSKEWQLARISLERYLSLAPEASDRSFVDEMLKNLPRP